MSKIAELWVVIGSKLEGFEKGMSDAERAMVKIGDKFEDVGKKMTIAGAAITGALTAIVISTAHAGDQFDEMSERTGISTEILSTLKLAADKSGTSIDSVARGMKFLAEEMIKTANATDKAKTILGALHIEAIDASGKLRNMNDVLFDVADKFAGMEGGALKTRLAVEIFGRAGMDLIPILNLGSKGLKENEEAARKLGIEWSGPSSKAAAMLVDALINLKAAGMGFSKTISEALMPTFKKFIESITEVVVKIRTWADAHPELTEVISSLTLALGAAMTVLGSTLIIIPKLISGFILLKATLGGLVTAFGTLSAAIALAYGAYLLLEKIQPGDKVSKETKAWTDLTYAIGGWSTFAEAAARKNIATMTQLTAVWDKYGQNTKETLKAIAEGREGKALQDFLLKLGGKHVEAAAGAKKQEDELKKLLDALGKTGTATKTLAEEMGIVLKIDLEKRYEKLKEALEKYSKAGQLTKDEEKKLKAALEETGIALGKLEPKLKNLGLATEDVAQATGIYALALKALKEPAENADQAFKDLVDQVGNFKIATEDTAKGTKDLGETVNDVADDMAKAFGEAFANIIEDGLNFANFWKSLWQGVINIISTAVGKIVTEGFKKLTAALVETTKASEALVASFIAFAAIVSIGLIEALARQFGFLKDEIILTGDALERYNEAMRKGTLIPTISKKQLQKPPPGAPSAVPSTEMERAFMVQAIAVSMAMDTLAKAGKESSRSLDEAWENLIATVQELGMEGSKAFIDLILKMRKLGLESKALNAYMQEWLNKIPSALSSLIAGFDTMGLSLHGLSGKMREDMINAIDAVRGSLDDMGILALTTFNAMIGSGMSWLEAVNAMKEPLAALRDKYAELGITGDEALERLFKIIGITEANKELFKAIDANKVILEALGNSGWLTQEAMTALTKQATSYYDKLKAAGLSSDDALRAMAPTLQKLQDYAAAYGFVLDDNTQSLIDQGIELGVVKATAKDASTVMGEGFDRIAKLLERIAKALGADISDLLDDTKKKAKKVGEGFEEGFDRAKDAATDAKDWINDKFKNLSYKVPITYETGAPPAGGGGGKFETYQHGGIAWTPQLARVAETGPEIIMPLSKFRTGTSGFQGIPVNLERAGGTMNTTVNIYAQRLDDRTIDEAAEKIFAAVRRQEIRRG